MNMELRPMSRVLGIVLCAFMCGSAQAQTKLLTWLRERIGERTAKDPEQSERNAEWQKEHFADQDAQQRFVTALKKTRCFTCHVKGAKRDIRHDVGERLSARIHTHIEMDAKQITAALKGRAPVEIRREIEKTFYRSLDDVLKDHVDVTDKSSQTFGEQWKRGELHP